MVQNVRRGLIRIWVFVSILWIGGALTVSYFQLREEIALLRSDAPEAPALIRCTETTDDALQPLCDLQKELQATIRKLDQPQYVERRNEAWDKVLRAGFLVAGPPVLVFLLLVGVLWVIRGFR